MKFPIRYNSETMTLSIEIGKHYWCFQCPFATWWKARKFFKKPKFNWFFGRTCKNHGMMQTEFGEYEDIEQRGFWPFASTEYLKWNVSKWFPISIYSWDICWKDKYNSPRYERPGYFVIFFGREYKSCWQLSFTVKAPTVFCNNDCTTLDHDDNYWESMLWYLHYADEYNPDERTRDIVKARNSMMQQHWSSLEHNDIKEFTIDRIGCETLYMGYDAIKDFVFADVMSDELYDMLENENPSSNLRSYDDDKSISLTIHAKKDNENKPKFKFERSQYIKLIDDEENNRKCVRIYFKYNNELLNELTNKDYSELKITTNKYVDLGPSFKDDFLTDTAIKEIMNSVKE